MNFKVGKNRSVSYFFANLEKNIQYLLILTDFYQIFLAFCFCF